MSDVLTKEFYDTVNNANIQWILLKNKINTNYFKNILDQILLCLIKIVRYQKNQV